MASKRKRRRQQKQREAAKKLQQMNTPPVVEKRYKEYCVATQLFEKGPVYVSTVKEHDRAELLKFICRIYEVPSIEKFTFLEVHHVMDDGNVEIIHDCGKDWPKGVTTIHNKGFVVRGKERTLRVGGDATPTTKPVTTALAKVEEELSVGLLNTRRYKVTTIPTHSYVQGAYG